MDNKNIYNYLIFSLFFYFIYYEDTILYYILFTENNMSIGAAALSVAAQWCYFFIRRQNSLSFQPDFGNFWNFQQDIFRLISISP